MAEPRYETQSFQIYHGLNQYQQALTLFGWEVINQQKINYDSVTTTSGKSRAGVFFKNQATHDMSSSTKHLYYTEITARKRIGSVPKAVIDIEDAFFAQLHAFVTPWVNITATTTLVFYTFIGSWIILAFFYAAKDTRMLYLSVIPPLALIMNGGVKFWKSHVYKNETYPVLLEGHMKIIRENPIE